MENNRHIVKQKDRQKDERDIERQTNEQIDRRALRKTIYVQTKGQTDLKKEQTYCQTEG